MNFIFTVRSIRNPTQAELDRLLTAIQPPEIEEEENDQDQQPASTSGPTPLSGPCSGVI